uniref:tyrosine-type recombinase/integrase n=1 Tax=uncultured Allobacillus sp. TaxID=1638025 RepID=UPI0025968584|nr:site-specific integrase [uncultured Allobacillus sp.]
MQCRKVKNKSGEVWECVADGPRNPATGKRNQIKRRGRTRAEAKKKVEYEIRSLKEDGIDQRANQHITFERLAEKWLEVYEASGVKRGSVRIRKKEVALLNGYFAKSPVADINHFMYQNMLIDLDKREYAKNTINGVNTCANMIFKYAKRNKLIRDNPREGAVVPTKPKTVEQLEVDEIEESYMEYEELERFLDAVMKIGLDLDQERFYTLAFTGMRPGELLALKKDDLDFENNTIRVSKTLYNENNNMREYSLETTKTSKARIVDMNPAIMHMLKRLIHRNDKHKMKNSTLIDDFHDENFVFQRPNGYPFVTKNIADRMRRILKYADIKKKLTPHSFRHTHISMLTEAGEDLPTIMERVGHEDPETTLKVYTHVTKKSKVKSVKSVTQHHHSILEKLSL